MQNAMPATADRQAVKTDTIKTATPKTDFVGRISSSANARNSAYRVKLYVSDESIDIVSADQEKWSWSMEDVTISRVSVDRFMLELAEERLYFLPVDPHGFLSDVVHKYSDVPVEPHRGWLRRRIEAAQADKTKTADGYSDESLLEENVMDAKTDQKRRGHVHEWDEGSAVSVITRRCIRCGHVSIDATGVTSSLERQLVAV